MKSKRVKQGNLKINVRNIQNRIKLSQIYSNGLNQTTHAINIYIVFKLKS